jgi:NitT/TauT family transport system ATP-binding protein
MTEEAIVVQGLSMEYETGRPVLANVSLSIGRGEFVSIVGPSGCGKTTLLGLIAGLLPAPKDGSLSVLGARPHVGNPAIAYMLARDSLLPWRTALQNAGFGMEVRGVPPAVRVPRARAMLDQVGLLGFEHAYPKALSQGMRQRVALARTFALDLPVLLMDEPFGTVDALTKLQLEALLLELWQRQQRTVVFVTHDLAEAVAVSDRVIVITGSPGTVIADVPIPLPRPRSVPALQQDPAFHDLYARVFDTLESGWNGHGR